MPERATSLHDTAGTTAHGARVPLRITALLALFKLRIGVVIAATAAAGIAIQDGPALSAAQIGAVFLGVLLASAAAGAFNQYYEADLDAKMARTRRRPFVTGRLAHSSGWLLAVGALTATGVALAWLAANALAALFTFLGAFVYAVVYTVWLKRRTWLNIVIGGAAGSFAVLAGAAAVTPHLSLASGLFAVILFLWTPPHFWSLAIVCRDDYAAAGVPMLPVVKGERTAGRAILAHTVVLVALSWLLIPQLGPAYAVGALAGGAWFVRAAYAVARDPSRANARRCFHASLAQLALLLVGVMAHGAL
jgi:protoheme IX farnesyltransferase